MTAVVAAMLLDEMNDMHTDRVFYRGQSVSRLYLRRILWRSNCHEDMRQSLKHSSKVLPIEGGML